jgi:hypothetical protein
MVVVFNNMDGSWDRGKSINENYPFGVVEECTRKKNQIFWPKKEKSCQNKKKKGTLHLLSSSRSLIHLEKNSK